MFPHFDPSKMTPEVIAELSDLMRTLSPDQLMKMQSLMHNASAGFNIQNEMIEFEKSLPSSFRERMARIIYLQNGVAVPEVETKAPTDEKEARLVILRSVSQGLLSPEEALKVLFP